jgi:ABC-2 type transport system permease protein
VVATVPELTAPTASASTASPPDATDERRSAARLGHIVGQQLRYAHRDFWRNPVLAFVTLGFPLAFLAMMGLAAREAPPDPVTGAGAIQAMAPIAAVFAAVMAAYVMLPFGIARARELGVLKRLRGTPLPRGSYLAGRVLAALWVATLGTTVMLLAAVLVLDLVLVTGQLPAMLLTFVAGVACFAALGIAAAALLRSSAAVLAFTMGSFLIVAFASGVFAPDLVLPQPLDVTSWLLPLRHFAAAFAGTFDLGGDGGPAWHHLAVLVGWGAAGIAVGARRLWRDPATPGTARPDPATAVTAPATRTDTGRGQAASRSDQPRSVDAPSRSPRVAALAWRQLRYANHQVWREPSSVFFAVLFPTLFVLVVPYAFGQPVIDGVPFAAMVTPSMAVFGAVVTAYVNMPEQVALAREKGVLKRLRGTPLPAAAYLTGRLASTLWVGALAVVGAYTVGWLVHGVAVPWRSVLPIVLVFLVGIPALSALGLAIVALVPEAKMVPAVALGTFLPLAFISGMFAFGFELPAALDTLGWVFPFKHLVEANAVAFTSATVASGHLVAVAGWGVAGASIAASRFRWDG